MQMGKIEKSHFKNDDIEKINAFSRRKLSEDEVYIFTATLCDNEIDRDFERFSPEALTELAALFIGKTGIADHSMKSSDQKARVFDTYVEKVNGKRTLDGGDYYCLKARAYMLKNEANMPLIEEIEAGIKKEISVSCSMGSRVCSICGADSKIERCEHIGGRRYGSKLCCFTLENAQDAYEFSFVAVPAQREAGVTKAYEVKEEKMNSIIDELKACKSEIRLSKSQSDEVARYIESLEQTAELGEEYKKELSREVVKLLALTAPELDRELAASVVSVMTARELIGFKKGLKKSEATAAPQLLSEEGRKKKPNYSEFKI